MVNFSESNSNKKPNAQTYRSLTKKLKYNTIWVNETHNLNEIDLKGIIYSWLEMSKYEKEKRLYITDFYNYHDYFHNMIAKIEKNII
jgi:hypothetical protein